MTPLPKPEIQTSLGRRTGGRRREFVTLPPTLETGVGFWFAPSKRNTYSLCWTGRGRSKCGFLDLLLGSSHGPTVAPKDPGPTKMPRIPSLGSCCSAMAPSLRPFLSIPSLHVSRQQHENKEKHRKQNMFLSKREARVRWTLCDQERTKLAKKSCALDSCCEPFSASVKVCSNFAIICATRKSCGVCRARLLSCHGLLWFRSSELPTAS